MSYHHLSTAERGKIASMHRHRCSIRKIARTLRRPASTISRKKKRNVEKGRYKSAKANKKYAERRLRCRPAGKLGKSKLISYISEKLAST